MVDHVDGAHDLSRDVSNSEKVLFSPLIPIKRELSIDSISSLLKRAFLPRGGEPFKKAPIDQGLRISRPNKFVTALQSHDSLNYYIAGCGNRISNDVSIQLYQFGDKRELLNFSVPSEGYITKCRFDPYGARFGASDSKGTLFLWNFTHVLERPVEMKNCHRGSISDFVFLNSNSMIATCAASGNHVNVCIWDTLMPVGKVNVKSVKIGEDGINCLALSVLHSLLICGGRRGMIFILDAERGFSLVNQFQAHDHGVSSLIVKGDVMVSGSTGGALRSWYLPSIRTEEPNSTCISEPGTFGITGSQTVSDSLHIAMTDGSLRSLRFPQFSCPML